MLSASEVPVHPLLHTEPLAFWTRRFVTPLLLSRSCIPLLLSQYSCSVSTVEVESRPSYTDNTALFIFWLRKSIQIHHFLFVVHVSYHHLIGYFDQAPLDARAATGTSGPGTDGPLLGFIRVFGFSSVLGSVTRVSRMIASIELGQAKG